MGKEQSEAVSRKRGRRAEATSSWKPRNPAAVDRRQRLKGMSTGGQAEQTYKHRARDAGDLADLRYSDFDKPRCREASGSVGPLRTRRSARPRSYRGARRKDLDYGVPGAAKEYGR